MKTETKIIEYDVDSYGYINQKLIKEVTAEDLCKMNFSYRDEFGWHFSETEDCEDGHFIDIIFENMFDNYLTNLGMILGGQQ